MKLTKPLLVACSLSFAAVAAAQEAPPMKPSRMTEAMMSNDPKDFYESAASANMLEIESSQLAQSMATDPQLKSYAEKMVSDHTQANSQLKDLAASKGVALPTTLLKRHQTMLDDLKNAKQGKDFDKEYAETMVNSHKEAVSLFDHVAREAKDPDVKAFATKMLPKLQQHGGMAMQLEKKF